MQLFVCLVLCYSFLIRLSNIQEVRFKEEAVLFQLFESFIQKTKTWCETVKYSKNWNKLSKLESLDHPGLGPPKGPTTGRKRWPFARGRTSCITDLGKTQEWFLKEVGCLLEAGLTVSSHCISSVPVKLALLICLWPSPYNVFSSPFRAKVKLVD